MNKLFIAAALFASATAHATVVPIPTDGWYQIQSADGAITYCQSGDAVCDIPAGTPVKQINHSTGEKTRFTVGGAVPDPVYAPTPVVSATPVYTFEEQSAVVRYVGGWEGQGETFQCSVGTTIGGECVANMRPGPGTDIYSPTLKRITAEGFYCDVPQIGNYDASHGLSITLFASLVCTE